MKIYKQTENHSLLSHEFTVMENHCESIFGYEGLYRLKEIGAIFSLFRIL